jgi:phosphodiesterase/alkaline phosphatase D-like protein
MHRPGLIPWLWGFARSYGVAIALVVVFFTSFVGVYAFGTGPVPQQPPEGYEVEREQVTFQWNRGTRKAPIRLQVSRDDPSFSNPVLDLKVQGKTQVMRNLENGHIYYWRLMQGDKPSPVATFKTSANAIRI